MQRRQIGCFLAVVTATLVWSAAAASAHAVFVGSTGFPVNSDQTITIDVPHERDDATWNVKVEVAMPSGWNATACQTKATWTCGIGQEGSRQVVTFSKAAGSAPAEDERFGFSVRTGPTEGTFAFPTIQTYTTGEEVSWIGDAGSDNPAPRLKALPSDAPPATAPPTTPPTHAPVTTEPPATPPSGGATTTTVGAPAESTTTSLAPELGSSTTSTSRAGGAQVTISSDDDSGGGAGGLLAAGAGVLLVAGAIAAVIRRQRAGAGNQPPASDD